MSRSIFLSLLTYTLLLAGIATVKGGFIALALPLVTYLIVGYLQAPEKINLEATRESERGTRLAQFECGCDGDRYQSRRPRLEEVLLAGYFARWIDRPFWIHPAPVEACERGILHIHVYRFRSTRWLCV